MSGGQYLIYCQESSLPAVLENNYKRTAGIGGEDVTKIATTGTLALLSDIGANY